MVSINLNRGNVRIRNMINIAEIQRKQASYYRMENTEKDFWGRVGVQIQVKSNELVLCQMSDIIEKVRKRRLPKGWSCAEKLRSFTTSGTVKYSKRGKTHLCRGTLVEKVETGNRSA